MEMFPQSKWRKYSRVAQGIKMLTYIKLRTKIKDVRGQIEISSFTENTMCLKTSKIKNEINIGYLGLGAWLMSNILNENIPCRLQHLNT